MEIYKFQVVLSLIRNYPILKSHGYMLSLPLAIICSEPEEKNWWKKSLSLYSVKQILATMPWKEGKKLLFSANSEPVFWNFKKGDRILDLLVEFPHDTTNVRGAVPIIFFDGHIPEEIREKVILIDLDFSQVREAGSGGWDVCPDAALVPACLQEIEDAVSPDEEGAVLMAAALFLSPHARRMKQPIRHWLAAAEEIVVRDQTMGQEADIRHFFTDCVYRWQRAVHFKAVIDLDSVVPLDLFEGKEYILYNSEHIFFPETLFRQIITDAKSPYSITSIKNALCKAKILKSNASRGFTSKITHTTPDGKKCRKRYLKIDRKSLQRYGDLDVITLCTMED